MNSYLAFLDTNYPQKDLLDRTHVIDALNLKVNVLHSMETKKDLDLRVKRKKVWEEKHRND